MLKYNGLKAIRQKPVADYSTAAVTGGGLFIVESLMMSMKKIELRCGKCRKLLGLVAGSAEIKCSRCGTLNKYDAETKSLELVPKSQDRRW